MLVTHESFRYDTSDSQLITFWWLAEFVIVWYFLHELEQKHFDIFPHRLADAVLTHESSRGTTRVIRSSSYLEMTCWVRNILTCSPQTRTNTFWYLSHYTKQIQLDKASIGRGAVDTWVVFTFFPRTQTNAFRYFAHWAKLIHFGKVLIGRGAVDTWVVLKFSPRTQTKAFWYFPHWTKRIHFDMALMGRGAVTNASSSYHNSVTLQHTATHCNTLQHTATHCNTLQHTATH